MDALKEVNRLINIGFTLHEAGKLDSAENAYQEALTLDSENAEVYNLLGVLKLQQNDVISARNWIEKRLKGWKNSLKDKNDPPIDSRRPGEMHPFLPGANTRHFRPPIRSGQQRLTI